MNHNRWCIDRSEHREQLDRDSRVPWKVSALAITSVPLTLFVGTIFTSQRIHLEVENPSPMSLTLSACFFQQSLEQKSENRDMCLAIPAKVVSRKEDKAEVDFGEGVLREVNVTLVEAKVGDYVLVHAGYAIQVLDEKEALETLRLWNEILGVEAATGRR